MKEFGACDADRSAYELLLQSVDPAQVKYIVHHQRVPVDARMCRLPLSLSVQAVLTNNQVVTAFQPSKGAKPYIKEP